jgi:hypothetical protein
MWPKSYSRVEAAFLVGVPLAWAVLLLFHPTGDEYYEVVSDSVTPWLVVHLGTMVFIPLRAASMLARHRRNGGDSQPRCARRLRRRLHRIRGDGRHRIGHPR